MVWEGPFILGPTLGSEYEPVLGAVVVEATVVVEAADVNVEFADAGIADTNPVHPKPKNVGLAEFCYAIDQNQACRARKQICNAY